jgi:hypothetical protein
MTARQAWSAHRIWVSIAHRIGWGLSRWCSDRCFSKCGQRINGGPRDFFFCGGDGITEFETPWIKKTRCKAVGWMDLFEVMSVKLSGYVTMAVNAF